MLQLSRLRLNFKMNKNTNKLIVLKYKIDCGVTVCRGAERAENWVFGFRTYDGRTVRFHLCLLYTVTYSFS